MKFIKLFENLDENEIDQVKKSIDDNQYITDKNVTPDKLVSSDKWIIYISQQTLDHIKSHMSPSVEIGDAPGSYYTQNWKKGIETVISKYEPSVGDNPPFRTAWTGEDAGIEVGFVTIGYDEKLKSGDTSGFKSYTYDRPVRGEKVKETILIKEEEAEKTNYLTIVGSKIGEVNGKGLISLWTTYPDFKEGKINGKDIPMNRNEFKDNGFYFKCSKEFFNKVPSEIKNESVSKLKYLKTFESFVKINEAARIEGAYDAISDMKEVSEVFDYIFNILKNEYQDSIKEENKENYTLKIQKDDRFVDIELDVEGLFSDGMDNKRVIMKYTDGVDDFTSYIVNVEKFGGERYENNPIGGDQWSYEEEGFNFELNTENLSDTLESIDNYLSGKVDYIE